MDVPPSQMKPHWFADLRELASKGSQTQVVGGLAGLAAARTAHSGQFWTPDALVAQMWEVAEPVAEAIGQHRKVLLLDNSIGTGHTMQHARADRDVIYGCDTDAEAVGALDAALSEAGFTVELAPIGMESVRMSGLDIALINPPFSVHLASPTLEPYPCTCSFGRFGPNTHALSHEYALAQALEAARVVVAVLPWSFCARLLDGDIEHEARLIGVARNRDDAFVSEGANVATGIALFSPWRTDCRGEIQAAALPGIGAELAAMAPWPDRRFRWVESGIEDDGPSITTPVTGDSRVRIYRRGARLKLSFACGLVEAKVMNALMRAPVEPAMDQRLPDGIRYAGEGQLDIEALIASGDLMGRFRLLRGAISDAGGEPVLAPGLIEHLQLRAKRAQVAATPLRHWVLVEEGGDAGAPVEGIVRCLSRRRQLLNPGVWGSCALAEREVLEARPCDGGAWRLEKNGESVELQRAELIERFEVEDFGGQDGGWVLKHPGRAEAFPELAGLRTRQARDKGLDQWLSWGFQFSDLVEMAMTPGGVVGGQVMGLGKARLAIGLCVLGGGRRNAIVVDAGAIPEMQKELELLGVPSTRWQVIESEAQARELREINLISYTRLRMRVRPTSKRCYGHLLRGRLHTVVADEAHAISNDTKQVGALYQLSPKRRYGLTGTPIGNYPRSFWPLAVWAAGDGTAAAQPYGRHRPYICGDLAQSMNVAERGADRFREDFVVADWVTYEFADGLQGGGKREVPSLNNVDRYRDYIGCLVLRRVWKEPEVAAHVSVPEPVRRVIEAEWDEEHLSAYLAAARHFADWWRSNAGADAKKNNLVAILARMSAVVQAATYPQALKQGPGSGYVGITPKQQSMLDWVEWRVASGNRPLVFARSPDMLAMMRARLAKHGVDAALYTGKVPLAQRTKDLDRFRDGRADACLLSFGVGQQVLNIPQADSILMAHRMWSPRQESQAEHRTIRPQQKASVAIDYLHLPGSVDVYQERMVRMKADSARAGLDWGTPEYKASDFVHWMAMLDDFCRELDSLPGNTLSGALKSLEAA